MLSASQVVHCILLLLINSLASIHSAIIKHQSSQSSPCPCIYTSTFPGKSSFFVSCAHIAAIVDCHCVLILRALCDKSRTGGGRRGPSALPSICCSLSSSPFSASFATTSAFCAEDHLLSRSAALLIVALRSRDLLASELL